MHVPSRFVAAEVVELLGVNRDRVHVIAHGIHAARKVPLKLSSRARSLLECRGARLMFSALGAVEPQKDLPTLVMAFAEVARDHDGLELVVAGPDGWGEPKFAAAVDTRGVGDRIVRVGYLKEAERRRCSRALLCLHTLLCTKALDSLRSRR